VGPSVIELNRTTSHPTVMMREGLSNRMKKSGHSVFSTALGGSDKRSRNPSRKRRSSPSFVGSIRFSIQDAARFALCVGIEVQANAFELRHSEVWSPLHRFDSPTDQYAPVWLLLPRCVDEVEGQR
jgi:hypothetical protein